MKMSQAILVFILTFQIGCRSASVKKVELDIARQPESPTEQPAELGRKAIANSDQLTAEQKEGLISLMDQTQAELLLIRKEETRVKSSLFTYVASGKFEDSEISTYRNKLKKLEAKKMDLMFSNIREVRKILGKDIKFDPHLLHLHFYRLTGE